MELINKDLIMGNPINQQKYGISCNAFVELINQNPPENITEIISSIKSCEKGDYINLKKNIENAIEEFKLDFSIDDVEALYNQRIKVIEEEKTEIKNKDKTEIKLPGRNRLISAFADELGSKLHNKDTFFYKVEEKAVVEIRKLKVKNLDKKEEEFLGFTQITPTRFVSLIEKFIVPVKTTRVKDMGEFNTPSSMSTNHSKLVIDSPQFQDQLHHIKRIFNVPIPILHDGKLTFPQKGYDPRFKSWLPVDSPQIDETINLEEAKKTIEYIYSEFPFEEEQDKINAVAGLLTPFLRGLYARFNVRSPIYFYTANRERIGKDYCANINGVVYEGAVIEDPPICCGDKNSNGNEELRKKILSIFKSGRKRVHFSNNKGNLDSAILEQLATNETFSDRALGCNDSLTYDNELDISLSGNMGITLTPDMNNRCKFVNQKLIDEDPNRRKFKNPDLHCWCLENRSKILSCLYCFVKEWYKKGMPKGETPFASFPIWAKICGGIMNVCDLGDPCIIRKDVMAVGGDEETSNMKKLYEVVYSLKPNEALNVKQIQNIIRDIDVAGNHNDEGNIQEDGYFADFDFEIHSNKIKFGNLIGRFADRILSDIQMKRVSGMDVRASRRTFRFVKIEENNENIEENILKIKKVGSVGSVGSGCSSIEQKYSNMNKGVGDTTQTTNTTTSLKDYLMKFLEEREVNIQDFVYNMGSLDYKPQDIDDLIENLKQKGDIIESKPGIIKLLQ